MKKKPVNNKIYIIFFVIYIFLFYFLNNFIYNFLIKADMIKAFNFVSYFSEFHLYGENLTFILSLTFPAIILIYSYWKMNKVKLHEYKGTEYGSSEFAEIDDIKNYTNDNPKKNIIISKNLKINADFLAKEPKYSRNKNILLVGGSGTGKTRYFVKPNLMQLYGTYIVTDPKGDLIKDVGKMFYDNEYKIKIFNLKDLSNSLKYNPFKYINNELDILRFVETIIENTKSEDAKSGEDFWKNSEKMYLQALIGYIMEVECEEDRNITKFLEYVNMGKVEEDNELDQLFEDLEEVYPDSFAVRMYKKFKQGAGDTMRSILISVASRTVVFDIQEIRNLLEYDQLDLENIGDTKTILFIILKDDDFALNFLASILYTQLLSILINQADNLPNSRFNLPCQIFLDEFANTGKIPNFEKLIATIRSRNISAVPVLQSKKQLEVMYKSEKAEVIVDNCDSYLFLGNRSKSTLTDLVEDLGKKTIDYNVTNISFDRNNKKTYSEQNTKLGRELMTRAEIAKMDNEYCLYQLRGLSPFKDKKFILEKHENFNLIKDGGADEFNVKEYLKYYDQNNKDFEIEEYSNINVFILDEQKLKELEMEVI